MTSRNSGSTGAPTPKRAAPKEAKRPKPARGEAFGILNPYGDLWTFDHFPNEAEARALIKAFWEQPGFGPCDLTKFKVIPVKVTVSAK